MMGIPAEQGGSEMPNTATLAEKITPLRNADRCMVSGCQAQAFIRARLAHRLIDDEGVYVTISPAGYANLDFCGHHGAQRLDALVMAGAEIRDERERINQKSESSANV